MEITYSFGKRVRLFRNLKKLSQEELAAMSGLHRTYIGAVERGERNITLVNAEKIAIALKQPLLLFFMDNSSSEIEQNLDIVMTRYQASFSNKVYSQENEDFDLLMNAFGITPTIKQENKQYWGRELGKCWESLVIEACKNLEKFQPALRIGNDEICDLIVDNYAIDTKYRIGSGDSGTLKKFKSYGNLLKERKYEPVLLFLREDNLPAAITAYKKGSWNLYKGKQSFEFIKKISGFDIEQYLVKKAGEFPLTR